MPHEIPYYRSSTSEFRLNTLTGDQKEIAQSNDLSVYRKINGELNFHSRAAARHQGDDLRRRHRRHARTTAVSRGTAGDRVQRTRRYSAGHRADAARRVVRQLAVNGDCGPIPIQGGLQVSLKLHRNV